MKEEVERLPILRVTEQGSTQIEDMLVRELPLTILLNNQEVVTLLCSPTNLDYLAIGCLFSEGLIKGKEEIKKIKVDEQRGVVWVETEGDKLANEPLFKPLIASGGGKGASLYSAPSQAKVESQIKVSSQEVFTLMGEFVQRSQVFKVTGGTHCAALADSKSILAFSEDIGRHNAIDKIFGECILKDMPTDDRIVITSGRVSSEILLKVAKRNIPILISKAAPTDLGVRLADSLGITLIGFVRGKRMNIYTNSWRVRTDA